MSKLKIAAEQILDLTDNGFEIIVSIYPDANKTKNFKVRTNERTASASIKLYDDRWKMTDFGGTITSEDCFGIYALDRGISYSEAIVEIGREIQQSRGIQIFDETREFYKYEFRSFDKADFPHELNEQGFHFETKDFTDYELDILGPFVKDEHCYNVGLHSLVSYSYYNPEKKKVYQFLSTDKFPILAFINRNENNEQWIKIYMPKGGKKWSADGKDRRFRYLGNKPKRYVFGLDKIQDLFDDGFEKERARIAVEKKKDISEIEDDQVKFKLDRVIIASGGSDGLNLMSVEENAIWFNSETEKPNSFFIQELKALAHDIILIPDADATGKRVGKELSLNFLEIKTVWLDRYLKSKTHKDFKDFMRSNQNLTVKKVTNEVKKMITSAMPAQFWEVSYNEKGRKSYSFHHMYAFYFLRLNGFCRVDDDSKKDGYYFARVHNHVVEELRTTQHIKDFFRDFLLQKQYELGVIAIPHALLNMMVTSQNITDKHLAMMYNRKLDFRDYTAKTQLFFLGNRSFEVSGAGIKENFEFNNFVLKSQLIDNLIFEGTDHEITSREIEREFVIDSPYFKISKAGDNCWDIQILEENCDFLNYLIQVSRVHWEKERTAFIEAGYKEEDFYEQSKFKITSKFLSEQDNAEQMHHLVNKIFTYGYCAHRYKDDIKAWSPFALDNAVLEDDVAEGGAGKSLFFAGMRYFLGMNSIDGKEDLDNEKFLFEGVTKHTDFILVDDVQRNFNFKRFFAATTGEMSVNEKFEAKVKISFKDSPKVGFTSNYSLRDRDGSTGRRQLIMGFSDYYHAKSMNRKSRDPYNDFGHRMYSDWDTKQWFKFLNFVFQANSFYLSTDEKIEAPEGNILLRSYLAEMGKHFQDWADAYIPTIIGEKLKKDDVLKEMQEYNPKSLGIITSATFKKKLNAWCKINGYRFEDRLMVLTEVTDRHGNVVYKDGKAIKKTTEHILITKIDDELLEAFDTNEYV